MSELEVRIVRMAPMRVASTHGFGEQPELEAMAKMLAFLEAQGLRFEDVCWFGFNNPNPSPGSPNYGYEVWATIGPDVETGREVQVKEIPERLYAVARCEGVDNIGEAWQQLVLWFEDSPYKRPPHWQECLEHLLTHPSRPYDEYVFDLHLPLLE
jgi:DNA gyrase inhibitor GyrI